MSLGKFTNLLVLAPEVKKQLLFYTDNWVENIMWVKTTENKIFAK